MNTKSPPLSLQQLIDQAVALQNAGAIEAAKEVFQSVLEAEPKHAAAHYSLGAIAASAGDSRLALMHFQEVVAVFPGFAPAYLALSIVSFNENLLDEALASAERALGLEPDLAGVQEHLDAMKLASQQRQQTAAGGKSEPSWVTESGRLVGEGVNFQTKDQHEQALALFEQALSLEPEHFPALYSTGLSLSRTGRLQESLDYFNRAVAAQPDAAIGHFALGKVLQDLGLVEAALAAFEKSLEIDPQFMQAHNSKAALLQAANRHHDALTTLVKASEINPNDIRTLEGQGLLLTQFKQFEWATNAFRRAMQIDPGYPYLEGNLMSARLHNCDWTDFDAAKESIFEGIRAGKRVCSPHTIMSLTDDAQLAQQCIEIYATDKYGPSMYTLWKGETYHHRRKRIAFISGDFRTHPVGYLLIGMIESLDKRRIEVTGVSTGAADGSELWKRYRCAFDNYLDVQGKPSLEIAELLRAMEMDIVVDLSGYTEGSRLDVLSHRPAPLQMTYLGFPGTLGLPFVDYLITDPVTVPPELQQFYREKVLYLPHCYLPRDTSVVPSPVKPCRADFGLPEEGLVFCSFNHDYKINPHMFKVWMELLRALPGSVLWLMKLNDTAHANVAKAAQDHGVDAGRIVFATRVPAVEDHLARYSVADVFLDTYPYNGHTTAGDALLAGVPTVTMAGTSFASRVALSLFNDLQLSAGIASSYADYFDKAMVYATDANVRYNVQAYLRSRVQAGHWPIRDELQAQGLTNLLLDGVATADSSSFTGI
jgi:predicted O-linked N-acetylglucosamine transferase (SPINDLY family)